MISPTCSTCPSSHIYDQATGHTRPFGQAARRHVFVAKRSPGRTIFQGRYSPMSETKLRNTHPANRMRPSERQVSSEEFSDAKSCLPAWIGLSATLRATDQALSNRLLPKNYPFASRRASLVLTDPAEAKSMNGHEASTNYALLPSRISRDAIHLSSDLNQYQQPLAKRCKDVKHQNCGFPPLRSQPQPPSFKE